MLEQLRKQRDIRDKKKKSKRQKSPPVTTITPVTTSSEGKKKTLADDDLDVSEFLSDGPNLVESFDVGGGE